ncbi:MAG: PEP-CTERM sorting domain-containing protein [Verrucomicrobiales bacterium]|jgi:hypothetical protein|nr:PEP-CTERM sorting domain-containing protein [Verrucomicrobiales bacterium]
MKITNKYHNSHSVNPGPKTISNIKKCAACGIVLALMLTGGAARAQWSGAATNLRYNDMSNWVGGDVNDTFVADSGTFGWGWSVYVENRKLPGDFNWNPARSVVTFVLQNVGTVTWTFDLAPTFNINSTDSSSNLAFGNSNNDNARLVFDLEDKALTVNTAINVSSYVDFINLSGLVKRGVKDWAFYRTVGSSGPIELLEGSLTFSGTGQLIGSGAVNAGYRTTLAVNSTVNALGSVPLNFRGAALNVSGATAQTTGTLNLLGGRSVIGASSDVTLAGLSRADGATLNVNLGAGKSVKISGDDSAVTDSLFGGAGADGTTKISIVTWATAENTTGVNGRGTDLVTYTKEGGFRALSATNGEYAALAGATALDNVSFDAAATVSADQTINALRASANQQLTISENQTLTVASGVIVGGANGFSFGGKGFLSSGSNPFIFSSGNNIGFYVENNGGLRNDITDNTKIGVIIANTGGGVTLRGTNVYTGVTVVQGQLIIDSEAALPRTTELRMDGGLASVSGNHYDGVEQLTGSGTLRFNNAGNANRLIVGKNLPVSLAAIGENNTLTVMSGGILAPGSTGGEGTGTLMLGVNVTKVVFDGGIFNADVSAAAADLITLANGGTLTIEDYDKSTLNVNFLNPEEAVVGASWFLTSGFTATVGSADDFNIVSANGFDYSLVFDNYNLRLTLDAIPEPSTLALLVTGAALWLITRRKKSER